MAKLEFHVHPNTRESIQERLDHGTPWGVELLAGLMALEELKKNEHLRGHSDLKRLLEEADNR